MAIRYDEKIMNEIRRVVRNYNAKIKRLEGRKDLVLPTRFDRQAMKVLRETTSNRADLRSKLKNLQEFT